MSYKVAYLDETRYYKDRDHKILHRTDGPAIERPLGPDEWWYNGKIHHDNEPAIIGKQDFQPKQWYRHGVHHRVDGPAVEWIDGSQRWYVNGKAHRLDGPATIYCWKSSIPRTEYFYVNDQIQSSPERFQQMVTKWVSVIEVTTEDIETVLGSKYKVVKW